MQNINWFDHLFNVLSVIIGVSLAFWVNDSAERTKKEKELSLVIDSFIEELTSDSITYAEFQIPDNQNQIQAINEAVSFLRDDNYDSLITRFERAVNLNNYHPSSNTFNSLTSSGKLDLIDDFQLKQRLTTYHSVLAFEAKHRGQFQVDFYSDELLPWMIYNLDFVNPDFDVIDKTELSNLLMIYGSLVQNKIRQYELLAFEAGKLKRKLEAFKNE